MSSVSTKALVALLWVSLQTVGIGQDKVSQESLISLQEQIDQADRVAESGDFPKAIKLYEAAAGRSRSKNDQAQEARVLSSIGRLQSRLSRHVEARQNLNRALELTLSAGNVKLAAQIANALGNEAFDNGSKTDARSWYEKSRTFAEMADDLPMKARALLNLSFLDSVSASEILAIRSEVAGIAHKIGNKELEADALHSWGDQLFTTGDYAGAMEKLETSAALYGELGNSEDLARVYTSMGRLNRLHGRPESAIPFYEKALKIQQKTGDIVGSVQSLNSLAIAYDALGKIQRSREYCNRAYKLALKTGLSRVIDFMRANLAEALIGMGEYTRAAQLLEEVLARGAESNTAVRHSQLAMAYMHMGQLTSALSHANLGVELSSDQPSARVTALWRRAQVRTHKGDLRDAMEDARQALQTIEEIRAKLVPLDFMKQGFSAHYQRLYSTMMEIYARQGQPALALEAAEAARARAFLDLLATRDVHLKDSDSAAVEKLGRIEQQLRAKGIDPYKTITDGSLQLLDSETAALLASWKSTRPEIQSFISAQHKTAEELVRAAKQIHSTILSYWVAEDAVFIGLIRPDGTVKLKRVKILSSSLSTLIDATLEMPTQRARVAPSSQGSSGKSQSLQKWQELYRLLIDPVKTLLPQTGARLTVIPQGPLMRLSFAALADKSGRYLLEDYALHYVAAGALLDSSGPSTQVRPAANRHYLLVADPAIAPQDKGETVLPPLPGAREEVRAIARMLPRGKTTVLV